MEEFIPIPKEPHNSNMRKSAEKYAGEMRANPSPLEKAMMDFLKSYNIKYNFQKIYYIRSKGGFIKQYYIVDFYIPSKKIILETDGKFHREQADYDRTRSYIIQKNYPKVTIVRWNSSDFHSVTNMRKLLEILQ